MKIAFLIRSLDVGGTERQLVNLATGLHMRGHAVSVITFYQGGAFAEELMRGGVPVVALEKRGRWDLIRFSRSLRKALESLAPEIIYSLLPVPNLVAAAARSTCKPRPRLVWGVRSATMDLSHYDSATRLAYAAERRLAFLPDCIVANSLAAKEEWRSVRSLHVISNGIDVDRFTIDRAAGLKVREELRIPENAVLIGNVGRLDPVKNHRTFLRAAAALKAGNSRFVVVGSGDAAYEEELKALAEELGISPLTTWSGARSDMPAVYNALDLLVSSSLSEAFPNVIAEAMACGVRCVVTNAGDSREIVADDNAVVSPGDVDALAAAIGRVLQAEHADATKTRNRIVSRFSIETMIDRTEALLQTGEAAVV